MSKKLVVDEDLCTGCGVCTSMAPSVFEMNDEGVSEVIDSEGADEGTIESAISSCPVDAISWEE